MAINILEMLNDSIGDQVAKQASNYLGETEKNTRSAFSMLVSALLGSLAKQGETTEGAAGLLKTLSGSEIDSGLLGNLAGLFSGGAQTDSLAAVGAKLVKDLLGDKAGALAATVASLSGLKSGSISKLLTLTAPLLFGFLKKLVADHDLFATDLMHLLQEQFGFIKGKLDGRVTDALGLGALFAAPAAAAATASAAPSAAKLDFSHTAADVAAPIDEEGGSLWGKLLPWLLLLAGLLGGLAWLRSCQPDQQVGGEPLAPPPAATAPAVATETVAEELPAKVYFDVGAALLDATANKTIEWAASAIESRALQVDITGYTDKTGDVAKNMELAKQRAVAVRDALVANGVAPDRITLKPPLTITITGTTTGSGSNAEARRVEISVSP